MTLVTELGSYEILHRGQNVGSYSYFDAYSYQSKSMCVFMPNNVARFERLNNELMRSDPIWQLRLLNDPNFFNPYSKKHQIECYLNTIKNQHPNNKVVERLVKYYDTALRKN